METNYTDTLWLKKIDFKKITQWVENGSSKKLQAADHWTIIVVHKMFKATSFTTSIDSSKSSFSLQTYAEGGSLTFSSAGRKFLCVGDIVEIQDPLTGEYDREQTWVHIGEFKDVPSGTF